MVQEKINILLTGGSGFIGKNIIENLSGKYNFLSPTSSELDLTDATAVSNFFDNNSVDIVLHAASRGVSIVDGQNYFQDNLKIFFNIIHERKHFKKMIFFGSGAEYDKSKDIVQIREDQFDLRIPQDDYGFYKYICAKYSSKVDFITHLRFFGVYGKYEDYNRRMISNIICLGLLGLPIVLKQDCYFDYISVNDLTTALELFIDNSKTEHNIYNICSGKRYLLSDIAKIILKEVGRPESDLQILKSELNMEYTGNNSRFIKEFKDFKFLELEAEIKSLINFYKDNLHNIKIV